MINVVELYKLEKRIQTEGSTTSAMDKSTVGGYEGTVLEVNSYVVTVIKYTK